MKNERRFLGTENKYYLSSDEFSGQRYLGAHKPAMQTIKDIIQVKGTKVLK